MLRRFRLSRSASAQIEAGDAGSVRAGDGVAGGGVAAGSGVGGADCTGGIGAVAFFAACLRASFSARVSISRAGTGRRCSLGGMRTARGNGLAGLGLGTTGGSSGSDPLCILLNTFAAATNPAMISQTIISELAIFILYPGWLVLPASSPAIDWRMRLSA